MTPKEILLEALRLPDSERAALAGELIESLDSEVDSDASAAWVAEVHRRVADLRAGKATTVSWAEARRRIHQATHSAPRR